jgi:predicted ATP-dependent serine protease
MRCQACHYKKAKVRGCCFKCYARVYKSIQRGETTWEEVDQKQLLGPKKRAGRKRIFTAERLYAKQ